MPLKLISNVLRTALVLLTMKIRNKKCNKHVMNTFKLTHYNDINAAYYLHSFQKTILDVEI